MKTKASMRGLPHGDKFFDDETGIKEEVGRVQAQESANVDTD